MDCNFPCAKCGKYMIKNPFSNKYKCKCGFKLNLCYDY